MANAIANATDDLEFGEFEDLGSFDELEKEFLDNMNSSDEDELQRAYEELETLNADREKIENPDTLGNIMIDMVWDNFQTQLGIDMGEEFIKKNHGKSLDLSNDAHKQTVDNFKKGKIATHNYVSADDLQHNYDRYKNTSHKEFRKISVNPDMDNKLQRSGELNNNGIETVKDIYTGRDISTETKLPNGANNPNAAEREHVTSSHEIYNDASLQMSKSDKELTDTINNPHNLQGYTTAKRNRRKSDNASDDMESKDKTKHWKERNKESKDFLDEERKAGEERLKSEGEQSQREEAIRMGGAMLGSGGKSLLLGLLREIIESLIRWLRSADKKLTTFLNAVKTSISNFVKKLKKHLTNAGHAVVDTIISAILGPLWRAIKEVWTVLRTGWCAIKKARSYLNEPKNRNKPFGIKIAEVAEIVVIGTSIMAANTFGTSFSTILSVHVPVFAQSIPLLGLSLGEMIGLFFGGLAAGIAGAFVLNLINKWVANREEEIGRKRRIDQRNKIMTMQDQVAAKLENKLVDTQIIVATSISKRHIDAGNKIKENSTCVGVIDEKIDTTIAEMEKIRKNNCKKLNQ